jgi:hypothetical protein
VQYGYTVKDAKDRVMAQMVSLVDKINKGLGVAIEAAAAKPRSLHGRAIVARATLQQLQQTMSTLLPQIRHWMRTGFVASGKIMSLHIPQPYSIVRGKVGKTVDGLNWGITRQGGGFLLATLACDRHELLEAKFAVCAVKAHIAIFGQAPQAFGFYRGGYSTQNVVSLRQLGVKEVGLAPRGRARWAVNESMRRRLMKERAMVEAGIGTIKSSGFNRRRPVRWR